MKALLAIVSCILLAGCRQTDTPNVADATLRTESEEFTRPSVGKVTIESTYRGDERILMVMSYSNVTTRTFCIHGDPVYVETDENGDGVFESLMISGETMSTFEQFRRTPEGTVEPISKEEYLELHQKIGVAAERMRQTFKEVGMDMK